MSTIDPTAERAGASGAAIAGDASISHPITAAARAWIAAARLSIRRPSALAHARLLWPPGTAAPRPRSSTLPISLERLAGVLLSVGH